MEIADNNNNALLTPPPVVPSKESSQSNLDVSSASTCAETPSTTRSPSPPDSVKVRLVSDDDSTGDIPIRPRRSTSSVRSSKSSRSLTKEAMILETPPRLQSTNRMLLLTRMMQDVPSPAYTEEASPRSAKDSPDKSRENTYMTPTQPTYSGTGSQRATLSPEMTATPGSDGNGYIMPSSLFSADSKGSDQTNAIARKTSYQEVNAKPSQPVTNPTPSKDTSNVNTTISDDESVASSMCPFDCVEDYKNNSTNANNNGTRGLSIETDDGKAPSNGKKSFFAGLSLWMAGRKKSSQAKEPEKDIGDGLEGMSPRSVGKESDTLQTAERGIVLADEPKMAPTSSFESGDDDTDEHAAVAAAAAEEEKAARSRRPVDWCNILICIAMVLILIVIAVLGVLILLDRAGKINGPLIKLNDNDSDPSSDPAPADETGTDGEGKHSFTVTDNGSCPNSAQVVYLQESYYGSTNGTGWDGTVDECGDSLSIGYGSWFTYEASESILLTAHTCDETNFDTQITIMSGSCGGFACVAFNDQSCGDQSAATWYAQANETYYIVVHGFREAKGSFSLKLEPAESNDRCIEAQGPMPVGIITSGTTQGSSEDNVPQCGDISQDQRGVWYVMENVEGWLRAEVLPRNDAFSGQVAVFGGGLGCFQLQCEVGSSQGSVGWKAETDSTYRIFVSSVDGVDGDFDLHVGWDWQDSCDNAIPFFVSDVAFAGSTANSRPHNVEACDSGGLHTAPGLWFQVTGNGGALYASSCGSEDSLDTQISVFQGECGSLQCMGGNGSEESCGENGEVSWLSERGTPYYVYVSGRGTRVGDFWLTISDTPRQNPTGCFSALALPSTTSFLGSTNEVMDAEDTCGDVGQAKGTWYRIEGSGRTISATVCDTATNYDARISLYSGSCGDLLQCIAHTTATCGDGDTLSWIPSDSASYFLMVHGTDSETTGDFLLSVEEAALVDSDAPLEEENSQCGNAIMLEAVTEFYYGNTAEFALTEDISCNTDTPAGPATAAAWYMIVGGGGEVTVSTCSVDTDFDTEVTVFVGGSCSELDCVDHVTDSCGQQAAVTWQTTINEIYYIRIKGSTPSQSGNYVMGVSIRSPFFGW